MGMGNELYDGPTAGELAMGAVGNVSPAVEAAPAVETEVPDKNYELSIKVRSFSTSDVARSLNVAPSAVGEDEVLAYAGSYLYSLAESNDGSEMFANAKPIITAL